MYEAPARSLDEVLEKHHRGLAEELATVLGATSRDSAATERTRTAEALNQAVRRLRQAPSQQAVLDALRTEAAAYGSVSVVLAVDHSQQPATIRLLDGDGAADVDASPALESVLASKDLVVALASETELGPALAARFAEHSGAKAYLFPVSVRQEVSAMLIVTGGVAPAPSELLCETAGLRLEVLTAPPPRPSPSLVQISQPEVPASETSGPRAWDDLSQDDQRLHLQAQRTARVKVAQMRLDHPDALRRGAFEGNIYMALKAEIDAARAEFLQAFLAKSATMVDYLHLEITRSLAHDDDRLLGTGYPGPMV